MSRTIEVEMKFEILDAPELRRFLSGLRVIGKKRIVDVYFDTRSGELFKRGIFIRVRNGKKFDIKFNQEDIDKTLDEAIDHTHCDEVSCPVPIEASSLTVINETLKLLKLIPMQSPSLESFVRTNNLIESITLDKQRTSYEDGDFQIDVDEVKGLGNYLEIEKMTDELADRSKIIGHMKHRLQKLRLEHVDVGYNELYWRKHNFDLYLQGKYLLAEDRKKYRGQSLRA